MVIAKGEAYAELYKKLDTVEGNKTIYKVAKTGNRRTKYICDNIFINGKEGKIQTDERNIKDVWQEHYVQLLNVTNREKIWRIVSRHIIWSHTQHHVGSSWNTAQCENWKSLWSGSYQWGG